MALLHKAEATPSEIRSQLERILASRRFAVSERSATFLRYVIDRTLAGDSAGIKEVVIAVEIPMGAAIAGPFAIDQAKLDTLITRVLLAERQLTAPQTVHDDAGEGTCGRLPS